MKLEKLNYEKRKVHKIFLYGLISVVVLLLTVTFIASKANYKISSTVQLAKGKINYKAPDLNVIAMYVNNGDGNYQELSAETTIPKEGYTINEQKSYCYKESSKKQDNNAKLYTDELGNHVIENISKSSKCIIYLDKQNKNCGNACQTILANMNTINIRRKDYLPFNDGVTKETAPTEKIIYQAPDDDGISYYFAGDPTDNWVKFGGYYWRIIRINGNGSIRMIYTGRVQDESGNKLEPQSLGIETGIGESPFNELNNDEMYVGYFYEKANGSKTSSTIYTYLNNWFENNSGLKNSEYFNKIDTEAGFCGDRQKNNINNYYGALNRISAASPSPTYKCADNNDLYTFNSSNKGNRLLENPVGLITADEVFYAGISSYTRDPNNYLKANVHYWTMSPFIFSASKAVVYRVVSAGWLDGGDPKEPGVATSYFVRPVINLRSDVELTGNGTSSNPYEVVIS